MRLPRARPAAPRRAFTLVELIVALLVGVIVAGATTASLTQFSKAKARASARQEAFGRAQAAAARIAEDARQLVRDHDLTFALVRVADGREGSLDRDSLLLLVRSLRPVRGMSGVPEGAESEVQYKVLPDSSPARRPGLWRRADAPPDKNELAGGVAQLVVPSITALLIQASDGTSWFDSWDSDRDGYPHALRVTVTATADDGVTTAVARRLIAIDRTPLPPPTTDASATTGSAQAPAATPTTGGAR